MGRSPLESAFSSGGNQQKSKKSFFYLLLLGVAGMATASSVFAASVTINSGNDISYSQGVEVIAPCDTDGIDASLGAFYSGSASEFQLDTITLTGVASTCEGKTITVELYDGQAKQVLMTGVVATSISGTIVLGDPDNELVDATDLNDALDLNATATPTPQITYQSAYTRTVAPSPTVTPDAGALAAYADRIVIEIN
ncbi:MAG: hypothetical protein RL677_887 [Actinomycetota bacterium]|jgi:hypothetical protein